MRLAAGRDRPPGPAPAGPEPLPREKKIYRLTCEFCNQPFETTNPMRKYCKGSHRRRAAELRKRLQVEK